MAGFCLDCSVRAWGEAGDDFEGLTTAAENAKGVYAYVLCEGCGTNIFVDHTGSRVDPSHVKEAE